MRRLLTAIFAAALLVPALAAFAGTYENYLDRFKDTSYNGNNGTLSFASPWYEVDPDGGGASSGLIHVSGDGECQDNECLHIEGGASLLEPMYVKRFADTSIFEDVELCFEIEVHNAAQALGSKLQVQVTTDGGGQWTTIDSWDIDSLDGKYLHPIYGLNEYQSEGFGVRFRVTNVTGLETFEIYIDTVEIKGLVFEQSTSTTSTTSPTTTTTKATTTTSQVTTTSTSETTSTSGVETTTSTTVGTTTTSTSEETTTTASAVFAPPGGPPADSGILEAGPGLMADYETGMMGDMDMGEVQVLGADVTADFSMAVEAFESAKVWIAVLALMIAAAVVSGMDSRRSRRQTTS